MTSRESGDPTTPALTNQISGIITGASVQAGAVHGGIHFHAPQSESPLPVPRQLLAAPAHFTDRSAELAALDAVHADRQRRADRMIVVLTGPGGVGKTALALQWAHLVSARFRDGQLYADLGGFSGDRPVEAGEALGLFLRSLGVPPQQVPVDLAEQAALYRSLTAHRSLLVLLDNAHSVAQVAALLPNSPTSAVLVTSRNRLPGLVADGARLLEVRPLEASSAVRLLANTVGDDRVTRAGEDAEQLVDLCGGLPIAVRVAAARLAARPRWSVNRIVSELADEQRRISTLSPSRELSVQATFDVSYRALPPAVAGLYRRLALHPGPDHGPDVAAAVVADPDDVDDLLAELVDSSLLEEFREDRYRFHDLLKLHAAQRARADESDGDRRGAVRRMLEWYLAAARVADAVVTPYRRRLDYAFSAAAARLPAFAGRDEALGWLEVERGNLLAAGRAAWEHDWFDLCWQLSDVLWPLFLHRKHYRDRLEVDQRGVSAARRWGNGFAEATMLLRLGLVSNSVGRDEDADTHLRAAIARATDIGDARAEADARNGLALLHLRTGAAAEAVTEFRALADRNRALPGARRDLGLSLINLAAALSATGAHRAALDCLDEAGAVFAELTEVDPYNAARVRVARAQVHCALRSPAVARAEAEAALPVMDALGSVQGQAEVHQVLAEAALLDRDRDTAVGHLRAAVGLLRPLGAAKAADAQRRLDQLLADAPPTGGDREPPA